MPPGMMRERLQTPAGRRPFRDAHPPGLQDLTVGGTGRTSLRMADLPRAGPFRFRAAAERFAACRLLADRARLIVTHQGLVHLHGCSNTTAPQVQRRPVRPDDHAVAVLVTNIASLTVSSSPACAAMARLLCDLISTSAEHRDRP
jgi:hypothetical protein